MPSALLIDPGSTTEASAWQELWERAANRTPFTHLAFVTAIADATGRRPWLVAVQHDGRLVAGAAFYTRPRFSWLAAPAPLTRYTGVLLDPPIEERHVPARHTALETLLAHVTRRFAVAALTLAPDVTDVRPFQWQHFACSPRYTYRIHPTDSFAPNRLVRRQVRAGNAYAVHAGDPEDSAFVRMLDRHNTAEHRASPLSFEAHTRLLRRLADASLVELYAIRDPDSHLVGAATTLTDANTTYMWTAGSEPGPAMAVLQHHIIEQARARAQTVDLVGANNASIAQFKSHFRGTLATHFHVLHCRSRILRAVSALRPFA